MPHASKPSANSAGRTPYYLYMLLILILNLILNQYGGLW
jgi:hypothetical protein